jgi:hypothetical protein
MFCQYFSYPFFARKRLFSGDVKHPVGGFAVRVGFCLDRITLESWPEVGIGQCTELI